MNSQLKPMTPSEAVREIRRMNRPRIRYISKPKKNGVFSANGLLGVNSIFDWDIQKKIGFTKWFPLEFIKWNACFGVAYSCLGLISLIIITILGELDKGVSPAFFFIFLIFYSITCLGVRSLCICALEWFAEKVN